MAWDCCGVEVGGVVFFGWEGVVDGDVLKAEGVVGVGEVSDGGDGVWCGEEVGEVGGLGEEVGCC